MLDPHPRRSSHGTDVIKLQKTGKGMKKQASEWLGGTRASRSVISTFFLHGPFIMGASNLPLRRQNFFSPPAI